MRYRGLDVALDDSFAEVLGPGGVAGAPFVILAHVNQARLAVGPDAIPGVGNRDFLNPALRIID